MSDRNSSGGVSIIGLLGVLFIGLKLTHYIDWSWWWVLAPFWGGLAFFFVLLIGMAIFAILSDKPARRRW